MVGAEGHSATFENSANSQYYELNEGYGAGFVESNVYLSRKLAARIGLRTEYSSLVDKADIAPRFSLAYKTGDYSQVSLASGIFWQTPAVQYLYKNPPLGFERADHLILNYQYIKNKRTFRIETFYKNYQNLVKEYTGQPFDANQNRFPYGRTDNAGKGYAQGFDVFFRDQKTFKNGDYWITYSFLDTKRDFMNYTAEATPTFASAHNVSLIYKYFIPKVQMSLSATYTYTSGRPYYNPNNPVFLADRTPEVNLMSISGAYLTTIAKHFTVIYFSVDNLFDTKNVFTYRYSGDGKTRYDVGPASYRSFFVGITISLSKKKELPSDMAKDVIKE